MVILQFATFGESLHRVQHTGVVREFAKLCQRHSARIMHYDGFAILKHGVGLTGHLVNSAVGYSHYAEVGIGFKSFKSAGIGFRYFIAGFREPGLQMRGYITSAYYTDAFHCNVVLPVFRILIKPMVRRRFISTQRLKPKVGE